MVNHVLCVNNVVIFLWSMFCLVNYEYCSGKHKCEICKKIYDCQGIDYGHNGGPSEGRCHGPYIQFCDNHTIDEYIAKHKELGELD